MATPSEKTQNWIRTLVPLGLACVGGLAWLWTLHGDVKHLRSELARVEQNGCNPSFTVRERLSAMDTQNSNLTKSMEQLRSDLKAFRLEMKSDLNEVKALFMKPISN